MTIRPDRPATGPDVDTGVVRIGEVMTRLAAPGQALAVLLDGETPRISPDATIQAAAAVMLEHQVDTLGVVDGDGLLVGMLTWSAIGRAAADRHRA